MVGQLILTDRGRGRAEPASLYGLPVLRTEVSQEGFWGERKLKRAGKNLRGRGVLRVLVPRGFARWPMLECSGLRPVDPELFVRSQSVPLALALLERQGLGPDRATVALRGLRADRTMTRTAAELCRRVRNLVVDAPQGGEELARWLRREFGVPILPPDQAGQAALAFQEGCVRREEHCLELYGVRPKLAGLSLTAPGLEEGDRSDLALLAALWEGGRLDRDDIKIT